MVKMSLVYSNEFPCCIAIWILLLLLLEEDYTVVKGEGMLRFEKGTFLIGQKCAK